MSPQAAPTIIPELVQPLPCKRNRSDEDRLEMNP